MIFNLYPRVLVKLGDDERHLFDRSRLMFTEVAEIEKVTGLSFGEWNQKLGEYSIIAVAALLHVLRKRDGQPSDFGSMQFNAAALDVVPVHEDGREYTAVEVAEDLKKRVEEAEAGNGVGPTRAAAAPAVTPEASLPTSPPSTSPSSPNGSESGRGNGTSSPTPTSGPSKRTLTRS